MGHWEETGCDLWEVKVVETNPGVASLQGRTSASDVVEVVFEVQQVARPGTHHACPVSLHVHVLIQNLCASLSLSLSFDGAL